MTFGGDASAPESEVRGKNVSGTVRVIRLLQIELTASGCIASQWVYRSIVNLLETPDWKFWDNMHTISL